MGLGAGGHGAVVRRRCLTGIPAPETIRKVRTKLRLSQRRAGALFRVGPNAFDKYERGLIEPSGPTVQFITILNRHPELVKELEGA